jgi:hypothetical protein
VFSVKIALEESVAELKKEIKVEKKPDFDSITADRLDLWKASVRVVEMFLLFIKLTGVHSSERLWHGAAKTSRSSIYKRCRKATPHRSIVTHVCGSSRPRAPPRRRRRL